jgi:zinc protease
MQRIFVTLAFLLSAILSAHAFSQDGKPIVSEYKLDNGMRVVVIPDRRAPVVTHMVWYGVGSADEPSGQSGIAHFLEHLMFKGTKNVPVGEFSKAIKEIGGQENAFTSSDYTAYYQKVTPDALPKMMEYEADRMQNVVLTEKIVAAERGVILEERSSRVDNNPSAILGEFERAALYVHHPYGIPVIGWEHEIAKLETQEILEFYEKWYQPWNAILVVAGDVDPDAVLKMAQATYGKLEATNPEFKRERLADPAIVVAKELTYSDVRVTNPVWRRTFMAPSYMLAEPLEAEALDLLSYILGDSVTSRIYQELVLGQEIATGAGAYFQGSSRDQGYFGLYATPRGDTTIEDLEAAMEERIDELLKNGVTEEEVSRARTAYLKSIIFSRDSQVTLARIFGSAMAIGSTVQEVLDWTSEVEKVTAEDVNRAARKYLDRSKAVTSYLLPKKDNS